MLNKIYHPNITTAGNFCSHCLGIEKPLDKSFKSFLSHMFPYPDPVKRWKTDTKLINIIKLVVEIVNKPLQVKFIFKILNSLIISDIF